MTNEYDKRSFAVLRSTRQMAVRSLVLAVYDKRSFAVLNTTNGCSRLAVNTTNGRSRSQTVVRGPVSATNGLGTTNGRSRLRAVNVCGLAVKRDKQSFAVSPTRQTVAVNIRSRSHGQRIRLAESDKRSFVVSRKSRHKTRKYLIIL